MILLDDAAAPYMDRRLEDLAADGVGLHVRHPPCGGELALPAFLLRRMAAGLPPSTTLRRLELGCLSCGKEGRAELLKVCAPA